MYQKHKCTHYRTCGKYKNIQSTMQVLSQTRTIVAQPVSDDLCEEVKAFILTINELAAILGTVKSNELYIIMNVR